jgi:chromate transporter
VPGLIKIAGVFARYANLTFGGGTPTTAVIYREVVQKRCWISQDKFILCFALARVTPGSHLFAFCTAVGWLLQRLPGAVVTLLAASIPGALLVAVLTGLFSRWQENSLVQAAIHGAIAAAVAIAAGTCWIIAKPHFKTGGRLRVVLIASAAFVLYVVLAIPAIEVLLLAGVFGFLLPEQQS